MSKPNDFPFDEVLRGASEAISKGATVYQKFTCERCKERLTMDNPNVFYETGKCERCDHVTDIRKQGCNYLVHKVLRPK